MVSNMAESPMVSILITSYNREKYIADAIESVLASTYTDYELIVVDDGSKDKTVSIARSYAEKDKRVKVYVNEKNLGDYPNRNQAAAYATGKYIKYIDADDMIYPWGLEVIVNFMEKYPEAGYGLDSIEQDPSRIFPIMLTPQEAYRRHYFQTPVFHKAPTSCLIKRDVFIAANGFSGKWMIGDFELWHKLSRSNNVLLMPMGIVWCRMHEEQESLHIRQNSAVVFKYLEIGLHNIRNNDCPLTETEKKIVINRLLRMQARSILRSLFIEKRIKAVKEKLKMATDLSFFSCFIYAFKNAE
jgi:glycosyltransferase involved in cell wall biosynthesis